MTVPWPPRATDEEREIRLFKDALMRRSMSAVGALLSPEGEQELRRRTAEVEDAYARMSERAPEELKSDAAPTYAQVLTAETTPPCKTMLC